MASKQDTQVIEGDFIQEDQAVSRKTGPSRDLMRRVQDQFLTLPWVVQFAREHGEDEPIDANYRDIPSIGQVRAILYPQWFFWFRECVDNREA